MNHHLGSSWKSGLPKPDWFIIAFHEHCHLGWLSHHFETHIQLTLLKSSFCLVKSHPKYIKISKSNVFMLKIPWNYCMFPYISHRTLQFFTISDGTQDMAQLSRQAAEAQERWNPMDSPAFWCILMMNNWILMAFCLFLTPGSAYFGLSRIPVSTWVLRLLFRLTDFNHEKLTFW